MIVESLTTAPARVTDSALIATLPLPVCFVLPGLFVASLTCWFLCSQLFSSTCYVVFVLLPPISAAAIAGSSQDYRNVLSVLLNRLDYRETTAL